MEIIVFIWDQYLYIPLFNFLIWLYSGYANYNLGIAIILLTIAIRIILLPFTIMAERRKAVRQELATRVAEIEKDFANDPVQQKRAIREFLRKRKVRHWAKAIVLGVQGLVLVLLYRVFISGVSSEGQLHLVYPQFVRPDFVDTMFLGIDIAHTNLILPAIVAGYIFAEILIRQWITKNQLSRREQIFAIFFPAISFLILALLPAVKSIFILTSLIFSTILSIIIGLIQTKTKKNQATK